MKQSSINNIIILALFLTFNIALSTVNSLKFKSKAVTQIPDCGVGCDPKAATGLNGSCSSDPLKTGVYCFPAKSGSKYVNACYKVSINELMKLIKGVSFMSPAAIESSKADPRFAYSFNDNDANTLKNCQNKIDVDAVNAPSISTAPAAQSATTTSKRCKSFSCLA